MFTLKGRHDGKASSCMICFSSRKTIQAIPKGSDLSTMLAFVSIVHIDKDIVVKASCSVIVDEYGDRAKGVRRFL